MANQDPSRTEEATPKRKTDARKKGSVPKSAEITKLVLLFSGVMVMKYTLGNYDRELREIFRWFLGEGMRTQVTSTTVNMLMQDISWRLARMLLPTFFILAGMAYIILRLQVGKLWVSKLTNPDFSKLFNPMAGIKTLLIDPKVFLRLAKQIAQAAAIGVAPYIVLKHEFNNIMPLFYANASTLASYILGTSLTMLWYTMIPMALIAVFDVWHTRKEYKDNLKMTKPEVKDERRNAEGDPEIKSKQKQKMMEVMGRRMLQNVPKADVIITNPTHIAVALQYNALLAPAPILVAKGGDHMAEKIKEIAREHGIPIKENVPLARALYKDVEIGDIIPEALYQAVAAILAQLNRFKARTPR